MDDLRATALKNSIDKQLFEKKDALLEELFAGCKDTDSYEKVYSNMVINAVRISTRLSVGLIMDMLIEFGLIKPADEAKIRRDILKLVEPKK